jgi:hypothetical protein
LLPVKPPVAKKRRLGVPVGLALGVAALVLSIKVAGAEAPGGPAELAPPAVVAERPVSNEDAVYTGFRTVTDDSGQLSVIVPEQWAAVESGAWTVDGQDVGRQVVAQLDGEAGEFETPGAVLAVSDTLGRGRSVDQVVETLQADLTGCTVSGSRPFDDNLYAGTIAAFTACGSQRADVEMLVAAPDDQSRIVMLRITRVSPRDLTARDRALETFTVSSS